MYYVCLGKVLFCRMAGILDAARMQGAEFWIEDDRFAIWKRCLDLLRKIDSEIIDGAHDVCASMQKSHEKQSSHLLQSQLAKNLLQTGPFFVFKLSAKSNHCATTPDQLFQHLHDIMMHIIKHVFICFSAPSLACSKHRRTQVGTFPTVDK